MEDPDALVPTMSIDSASGLVVLHDAIAVLLAGLGIASSATTPCPSQLDAKPLPVTRWLPRVLTLSVPDTRAVCDAMARVAPHLYWRQNESYRGESFLDRYGYCELAGPAGHWRDPSRALGVLLLGPEMEYPAHAHPAPETYVVLAGAAQWRIGSRAWTLRQPGEVIVHGSQVVHAMRTASEPLLACYLWIDHLDAPARLVDR